MEIQFYGANCMRVTTKKAAVVVDDNLVSLGRKSVTKAADIVLQTFKQEVPGVEAKIIIEMPGEYEVADVSVVGVSARAHMDEAGKQSATMYKIEADDIRLAVVGHIYPDLTETQLEALGVIDVLVIPVGGSGYTLDPVGALKVIKKIEPKIIIPTHYDDKELSYEVPQQSLDEAVKGLAMEVKETVPKLKLKGHEMADVTQLIVLERQ